jgi:uncharacterized membrane protein YkoI
MNSRLARVVAFLAAVICTASAFAESKRELHAAAKVRESDARKVALGQVPPRSVVESIELEREGGKLVWSYDIRAPASNGTIEVQIDAISGEVANKHNESPKDEAAEVAADHRNSH